MHIEHHEKEYAILENIYHHPDKVRQRDLSHIAGISLGMTNAILKRLVNRGLVIARKINHRTIHYMVTPSGINEIMQRSYRYFKRTIKHIVYYKEKIRRLVEEIARNGYKKIILIGASDLDFIIEYCARQANLSLERETHQSRSTVIPDGAFCLLGEKAARQRSSTRPSMTDLFSYLETDSGWEESGPELTEVP